MLSNNNKSVLVSFQTGGKSVSFSRKLNLRDAGGFKQRAKYATGALWSLFDFIAAGVKK